MTDDKDPLGELIQYGKRMIKQARGEVSTILGEFKKTTDDIERIPEYKAKIGELTERLNTSRESQTKSLATIRSLREESDRLAKNLAGQISSSEGAIGKLRQENSEYQSRLASSEKAMADLKRGIVISDGIIDVLNSDLRHLQDQYDWSMIEAEGMNKEAEEISEKIARCESANYGLKATKTSLESQVAQLTSDNSELSRQNAAYDNKVKELNAELALFSPVKFPGGNIYKKNVKKS